MKKLLITILAFCMALGSFSSCMMMPMGNNNSNNVSSSSSKKNSSSKKDSSKDDEDDDSSSADESEDGFYEVLSKQAGKSLKADETVTYDIDEDISGKNYIKLEYQTEVHLYGVYTYANADNPDEVAEEEFFIEAGTSVFKQFLDTYRKNSVGAFDKILKSISFTNKSGKTGEMRLSRVAVSDRTFVEDDNYEIYIQRGELKVGADLALGGSLTFLSRTAYQGKSVDEYETTDGNVAIDVDGRNAENCKDAFSVDENGESEVNLINIYDAGRQIQQSWYANVGGSIGSTNGENGYMRTYCYTGSSEGWYWPYNPVQAGDAVGNLSQIIDYEVTQDSIWVKTRAMDWAKGGFVNKTMEETPNAIKGGSTTKSYMETTYKIAGNMLFVDNRFIDWNGFYDMHLVLEHSNELPAFFVSQAFDTFVCYEGRSPWTGGNLTKHTNVGTVDSQDGLKIASAPEDWSAWVNENGFGVGVYTANKTSYSVGRNEKTRSTDLKKNKGAFSCLTISDGYLFNKPEPKSIYTSCYVFNTSYIAPVVNLTMKEYEPMEYSYAVCVDYIDNIRSNFKDVYQSGEMPNDMLKM